jgi:MSHA biogenesis protein MshK
MNSVFRVQGSRFHVRDSGFRDPERGIWKAGSAAARALGAILALVPAVAAAQIATDPTRPPAGLAADPALAGEEAGGGPVLQTVMISPSLRAAIISGRLVRLGEKYGDAVLVKVSENEVVLRIGDELQVLRMHPRVEKRDSGADAPGRTVKPPRAR